jgi:8-hydroxy-5-deazaflavin:NADPH oxidoreductase
VTETPILTIHSIAIIGGTGREGKGLGYRWARAGYRVTIGSRTLEKAQAAAAELNNLLNPGQQVQGALNADAVRAADLAVITVPYAVHADTLRSLQSELAGKILVDVTVPLVPPKVTKVQLPPAGSAAQEAAGIVGQQTRVCAAFQNISYEHLMLEDEITCDVLVTGVDKEAREQVLQLVADTGMQGWDAGPIENSVVAEGLTSILIGINKKYGVQSAGIRITGVPRP